MRVLSEQPLEERPSTITAFVHVVTLHKLLHRKFGNFSSVLQFESRLNNLYKTCRIARATWALVPNLIREVIPINITVVISLRYLTIWNILSFGVLFAPFLRFQEYLFELFGLLSEFFH